MRRVTLLLVAAAVAGTALLDAQQPQTPAAPFTRPANTAIPAGLDGAPAAVAASPRHGEWVQIKMAGGAPIKAWVVYPEVATKAGVVLIIHDIYGMAKAGNAVAWPQAVADQFAKDGFIGISPDLLSGGASTGDADAVPNVNQAIQGLKAEDVVAKLDAVMAYGKSLPSSNGKTAVVGFCWGGSQSFSYAIAQPGLSAAAVYYGQVPGSGNPFAVNMDALGKLKVPVIGLYGGNDARITSTVEPTKAAAAQLGKTYDPHIFEGAGHGFLRGQTNDANYKAASQAWPLTIAFFKDKMK